MPLAKSQPYLVCLVFLLGLSSCRTINTFFATKAKQEVLEYPDPDGHCIQKDAGWAWVEKDCRNIEAHLVAATVAYLRVLWTLNSQFANEIHSLKFKRDFAIIYTEASNAIVDAVLHAEGETFKVWYRTMAHMREHSVATNPDTAYHLSYRTSYEHLYHEESKSYGVHTIATQFGKEFFKFMPIDKTNNFPYPSQELIDLLREAELSLARAFSLWNEGLNPDKNLHDANAALLEQLWVKIYSPKGQR